MASSEARKFPQVHLQVLKTLLEIHRLGSAQLAAEKVGLTVSAVARQIKHLENELGVPLFERIPRGMRATKEGVAYADMAKRIILELDHAAAELDAIESTTRGHVRVHVSEALVDDYLLREIDKLMVEFPKVTIEATIAFADQARDALLAGTADVATLFGMKAHEDIEVVAKHEYPLVAVVAPDHKLALDETREIEPEALLDFPLALPPRSYATRIAFEELLPKKHRKHPSLDTPSLSLNSLSHLIWHVSLGHSVAVLPALTVRQKVADGALRQITIKGADAAHTSFTLCRHREHALNPAARILLERLLVAFKGFATKS